MPTSTVNSLNGAKARRGAEVLLESWKARVSNIFSVIRGRPSCL